jgi:MOSC domain-containing protein YiiM
MKVVSVNVADVRDIELAGRPTKTGLFKLPVDGRVEVDELGLVGDTQVDRRVHGGPDQAVYAYAQEDVAWWETELDRELGPGFFGENLTLAGVDVNGATPGERWEIGSTALEVTRPRQPCTKLAARVGDLGFVRRFAQAGRPGAYLRVVREGELGAGDVVKITRAAIGGPTMAELSPGRILS